MESAVVRQIRTSGRGSGSVEVTLPAALRQLVGLQCRIFLRDGEHGEIVLQPDMAPVRVAFHHLWSSMARIFLPDDAVPFPERDFVFSLVSATYGGKTPNLSWSDGLALARRAPCTDAAALARTIAGLGAALASRLAIGTRHSIGFGATCGMLATGLCPFPEWQEPIDIAASSLASEGAWRPGSPLHAATIMDARFWDACAPMFVAAADLFASWSESNSGYEESSVAWRRGRSFEMNRG